MLNLSQIIWWLLPEAIEWMNLTALLTTRLSIVRGKLPVNLFLLLFQLIETIVPQLLESFGMAGRKCRRVAGTSFETDARRSHWLHRKRKGFYQHRQHLPKGPCDSNRRKIKRDDYYLTYLIGLFQTHLLAAHLIPSRTGHAA